MLNASNIRCLITAGPTREFFDPVRYLSNPSTGKMGFAIAQAAIHAGWTVDLVAGPVGLEEPDGAILYPVITAEEMFHQVDALFDACDMLIMTAAVSDFRPAKTEVNKVKKSEVPLNVELEPTVDILRTMAERKHAQVLVGFAAETNDVESNARQKLEAKGLDWIVANQVGGASSAFGSDRNEVLLIGADGSMQALGPAPKTELAEALVQHLVRSGR